MARTSTTAVKNILRDVTTIEGGDYDGVTDVQQYIDAATLVVDRVVTCAVNKGLPLTAAELEMVERYLAAHFYAMSDQTYASRSTSGASGSFHGQTGMHLEATKYGQNAITIDPSGCLRAIGKGHTAGLTYVGKVPSERIPYENRD